MDDGPPGIGDARPVTRADALVRETRRQLREAVAAAVAATDPEDLSPLEAQIDEVAASGPGPGATPVLDEPEPGRELFDDAELARRLGPELSLAALGAWAEAEAYDGADVLGCAVRQTLEAVCRCGETIGLAAAASARWLAGLAGRAGDPAEPDPEALRAVVAFCTGGPTLGADARPWASPPALLEACIALTAAAVQDAARRRGALAVDVLAWAFPEAAADRPTTARQLLRLGLSQPGCRPLVPLPGIARVAAWRQIDRDESWQRFPDAPEQLRGTAMTAVVVDPVPPLLRPEALAADGRPRVPTASVGVITYDNGDGSQNAYVCVMVWDSLGPQAPGADERLLLALDPGDDRDLLASLVREGVLSLSPPSVAGGPPPPAMVIPLPAGAVAEAVLAAADGMGIAPAA